MKLPRSAVCTIRLIVAKSMVGSFGASGSRQAVMCIPPTREVQGIASSQASGTSLLQ